MKGARSRAESQASEKNENGSTNDPSPKLKKHVTPTPDFAEKMTEGENKKNLNVSS